MAIIEIVGVKATKYKAVFRGTDKRQHVAGTFATRREAEKAYDKAMAGVLLGVDARPPKNTPAYVAETEHGVTLAVYADRWLPDHPLGAHAKDNYDGILRAKIKPELGNMALADITVPVVAALFRRMERAGASAAYISKTKTVLSAVMQSAAEDEAIPAVTHNPVRGIKIGGSRPQRRKAITKAQFAALLAELPEDGPWRLLCRTIAGSGLRIEEATGLQDTDLQMTEAGCWLSVTHVLVEYRLPPEPGSTKRTREWKLREGTKTGRERRVKIDPRLAAELAALPKGPMFLRPDGGFIAQDSFRKLIFRPAAKRAGISAAFTPRDLRRAHASWLRDGGANLEAVRDRLGHATLAVTDRYLSEDKNAGDAALDALGDIG